MRHWALSVEDLPDPVPQSGQALTWVLACGICGSDLHVLQHGAEQLGLRDELAAENLPDPLAPQPFAADEPVVMGHEFCCEVVELGPGCENLAVGDVVVSMPGAIDAAGVHAIGYSNRYPGGYGELPRRQRSPGPQSAGRPAGLRRCSPNRWPSVHAVAKSGIGSSDAAVVLGCGPVGLAVIADLARRGVGPIVAPDYPRPGAAWPSTSAPTRWSTSRWST